MKIFPESLHEHVARRISVNGFRVLCPNTQEEAIGKNGPEHDEKLQMKSSILHTVARAWFTLADSHPVVI